ncbi:hypothetical protein [Castellaniella sp.]|uniref:hypothetical protein n=1 Tax=Castellaniella sp. TaxID=1955812 RepID=UPI002AFE2BF7|nr:hypothetical protein [Castellaniella sp.]
MSKFDPSKLNARTTRRSSGPRPERLFLVVDHYETPEGGFHYAVGHRADQPDEQVRVRLNTVAERVADLAARGGKAPSEDAVKAQYVTGENTRDSLQDKAKADIRLIAFDDARRVGENDGVAEYRAHWPKTISTQPEAELLTGKGHIRLRDAIEHTNGRAKAQAYIELITGSTMASAENVDQLLHESLTIKDAQGRARDPLMILRVHHDGKVVGAPRLYPSMEATKIFDQALGEEREVGRRVDAAKSVENLLAATPGRGEFQDAQLDTVRAIVSALKGLDEPKFNSTDEAMFNKARNMYWGVREGALQVEVVSAEKIDFGADTRKTYLKDKDRPHLAAYTLKEPKDETSVREVPAYTDTVVGILRHEDGEPYAVYASPQALWPKAYKLADLHLPSSQPAAEAEANAQADATASAPGDAPEIPAMAGDDDDYDPSY